MLERCQKRSREEETKVDSSYLLMINRNFDIYARKRGFFKISTNNKTVEQIVDEVYTHIMMEQ